MSAISEHSRKVIGSELVDGGIIYITGRWQRVDHLRQEGPHFLFRTPRSGGRGGTANAASMYDALVCPGCDQVIAVTSGDGGASWYSECGGEGEGGCEPWCDGLYAAERAHEAAIAVALGQVTR